MKTNRNNTGGTPGLVASFKDEEAGRRAVMALTSQGVPAEKVSLESRSEQEARIETARMRDEVEHFTGGPGVVMTGSMARGALTGALAAGAAGAAIGTLLGLVWALSSSGGGMLRIVIPAVALGTAGAVAGFMAGGYTGPRHKPAPEDRAEFEDEPLPPATVPDRAPRRPRPDDEVVVVVDLDDRRILERAAAVVESHNPISVDRFGSAGKVEATELTEAGRSDFR